MEMTNNLRLWVRTADLRPGFEPSVGVHAVVGDEDAEPRVARIMAIDPEGNLELLVLSGSVESHRDLLARATGRSPSRDPPRGDGNLPWCRAPSRG